MISHFCYSGVTEKCDHSDHTTVKIKIMKTEKNIRKVLLVLMFIVLLFVWFLWNTVLGEYIWFDVYHKIITSIIIVFIFIIRIIDLWTVNMTVDDEDDNPKNDINT